MWMFPILSEGRDNSVLFFSLTWIGLFFLSSEQLWSLCWRNRFSTQDGRYWCKMRFWFIILETQKFLFLLWCSQSCWFHLMWNTSHRISFSSSISVCVCYLLLCSFFVCLFVWLFGCLCFQMHPRLLGHWSTWRVCVWLGNSLNSLTFDNIWATQVKSRLAYELYQEILPITYQLENADG